MKNADRYWETINRLASIIKGELDEAERRDREVGPAP